MLPLKKSKHSIKSSFFFYLKIKLKYLEILKLHVYRISFSFFFQINFFFNSIMSNFRGEMIFFLNRKEEQSYVFKNLPKNWFDIFVIILNKLENNPF